MPGYDNITPAISTGPFGASWSSSHSTPFTLDTTATAPSLEPNAFGSQFDQVDEVIESLAKSGKLYQFNPNAYLGGRQSNMSYDNRFGQLNSGNNNNNNNTNNNNNNRLQGMNNGYQNPGLNRLNLNKPGLNSFVPNISGPNSSRVPSNGFNGPNPHTPQGFNHGSASFQLANRFDPSVSATHSMTPVSAPVFTNPRTGTQGHLTPQVTNIGRNATAGSFKPAALNAVTPTTDNGKVFQPPFVVPSIPFTQPRIPVVVSTPAQALAQANIQARSSTILSNELPTNSSNKLLVPTSSIVSPPTRTLSSASNRIKAGSPKLSFDPFSSASDFSSGLFVKDHRESASPPSSISSSSSRRSPHFAIARPGSVGSGFTPGTPLSLNDSVGSLSAFSATTATNGSSTMALSNALSSLNLESDDFFPSSLARGLTSLPIGSTTATTTTTAAPTPPSSASVGWSNNTNKAFGGKSFGMTTASVWG